MASVGDAVKDILHRSDSILEELTRTLRYAVVPQVADTIGYRAGQIVATLEELCYDYLLPIEFERGIDSLINLLNQRLIELQNRSRTNRLTESDEHVRTFSCSKQYTGKQGRPSYFIPQEQIEGLRELGFSWKKIAEMLSISERTLINKRRELDIEDKYTHISEHNIDIVVGQLLRESPNMGEKMLKGALLSKGITMQRRRLRESVERVDPVGKVVRRFRNLKRRVYSVEGPNALWLVLLSSYFLRLLRIRNVFEVRTEYFEYRISSISDFFCGGWGRGGR